MDRWERKNTRSSRMAGQTNRRTCICDSTAVGQLCTINKVIHLPQKLFENLHENPDGHRMTYPVSSSIRLACNKNLFAFKYLCPGLGNRYSFWLDGFGILGFALISFRFDDSYCIWSCLRSHNGAGLIPRLWPSVYPAFQVLNSRIQSNGLASTVTYLPQTDSELITLACWASNAVGRQTTPCLVHILPASK